MRFMRSMGLAIIVFVLAGMFAGHGSVQVFATAAVVTGLGWAVVCVVGRLVTRVSWRDLAGAAFITMFVSSVMNDVRELPRRWR
jgi:uncharacterized transporter YbjL